MLINPFDIKQRMVREFADGYVGFRYILKFIKAWFSFKVRKEKNERK